MENLTSASPELVRQPVSSTTLTTDQLEYSPPASPKMIRQSVSPATSTPDQHQATQSGKYSGDREEGSPARVRQSELSESEESAILNSYTEGDSTAIYEKPENDTTIMEKNPEDSCVADNTRSKRSLDGPNSSIAFNLSNLMEMIKNDYEDKEENEEK